MIIVLYKSTYLLTTMPVTVFGRLFVKQFALSYPTVVSLSVLSVMSVYCGQTVGWIKMKLGVQVGLCPGHIVLDGLQLPPKKVHNVTGCLSVCLSLCLSVCLCDRLCLSVCVTVCLCLWQCVQLIVCDWLLTCRSEVWLTQHQSTSDSQTHRRDSEMQSESSTTSSDLTGYKRDLTSLRHLAHTLRAAVPRVCTTVSMLAV